MPLRTIVVIAVLSLVWLGYRRAERPAPPGAAPTTTGPAPYVAPVADGSVDLVLEARDRDGRPVVALELTLERSEGGPPETRTLVRSLAADTGRYVVDGLEPGRYRLTLTARDGRILDPAPGTWVTLPRAAPLPVRAEAPATLELEVIAFDGHPLAGVEVVLRPAAGPERTSTTDALGRVRSGPLPVGVVAIEARRAGAELRHRVALAPEARAVERLRLPGGALVGRALGAAREPLRQRRVEVLTAAVAGGAAPRVLATATTDGLGRFEVPWLPPGPAQARLVADPGEEPTAPSALRIVDGTRAEATLALAPRGTACAVRGRFLLEREPLAEAELTWVAGPRGGPGATGAAAPVAHVVRTDREGRFVVDLEHVGPWVVLAALPGRPSIGLGDFVCPTAGTTARDLFAPVGAVQGRVVDADGVGVGGARIECVPAAPWAHGAPHTSPVSARTVADGSFEVGGLLVGPWIVHAWPEDPTLARVQTQGVEVRADTLGAALDLVVPLAGALRVRLAGAALDTGDAVQIELRDAAGRYVFPEAFAVRGALGDGVPVPGLPAGTYRCAVRSSLRVSEWTEAVTVRAGAETEIEVTLRPGGELDLTLEDAAGKPIAAALELLDADGNDVTRLAEPTSPATGRYRVGPLPAGRYTLVARAVDGTTARRELALDAGLTLTLALRTGG